MDGRQGIGCINDIRGTMSHSRIGNPTAFERANDIGIL